MSKGRILIVEDDEVLLTALSESFARKGYDVLTARDGASGLGIMTTEQPDLILLDIMLPRMNGYEVCRAARERDLDMPILMLTAKGREEDVVLGLNLGADDYISKPFRIGELLARVGALLRRSRASKGDVYRFGRCELNRSSRTLLRNGREVELTVKEYGLLEFMVQRQGRALSRRSILDAVWGSSFIVTPRSIDRCVTTLRAKIEPDPREPTHIHTIREVGYRFEAGD